MHAETGLLAVVGSVCMMLASCWRGVGWFPLQDNMATLSTNSSHRVVPHTHDALVNDKTAAEPSSQAIRDVVHAVRSDAPLEKS
jgi:hypothetical protein